jgi:hypothetical protein
VADSISSSAGLEAANRRREQEWKQQLQLAEQELKQSQQQQLAAAIRVEITERDLVTHDKNIDQAEELDEFYKNKFTKLGLYNYLSTSLNRLYRQAYNLAHNMSIMAELAYEFETNDNTPFIAVDNWSLDNAGLLAGERLTLQLQELETAFIINNKRDYEITQSFSLSLLNPEELLSLREKGECNIEIPEIFYDLLYPGQYKRIIKSVRLTLPCIVGPYANVSAKVKLKESKIRIRASTDDSALLPTNDQKLTSIATSNAQGILVYLILTLEMSDTYLLKVQGL